jgi:hypothetical protein
MLQIKHRLQSNDFLPADNAQYLLAKMNEKYAILSKYFSEIDAFVLSVTGSVDTVSPTNFERQLWIVMGQLIERVARLEMLEFPQTYER